MTSCNTAACRDHYALYFIVVVADFGCGSQPSLDTSSNSFWDFCLVTTQLDNQMQGLNELLAMRELYVEIVVT